MLAFCNIRTKTGYSVFYQDLLSQAAGEYFSNRLLVAGQV